MAAPIATSAPTISTRSIPRGSNANSSNASKDSASKSPWPRSPFRREGIFEGMSGRREKERVMREFRGQFSIDTAIDTAFELFSPLGERTWVPGWNPELLYPPDVTWALGQIFRTQEEKGEAIWIVTRLDREARRVEYHRVEPGR